MAPSLHASCASGWKWSKATSASLASALRPKSSQSLQKNLDLIINSSGLTDFNPDLRDALATNVDAAVYVTEFVRQSDHAGLLHLSTCYVAGARDGRVGETHAPELHSGGSRGLRCREGNGNRCTPLRKEAEQRAEARQ